MQLWKWQTRSGIYTLTLVNVVNRGHRNQDSTCRPHHVQKQIGRTGVSGGVGVGESSLCHGWVVGEVRIGSSILRQPLSPRALSVL